jgi:DNA-binding XRE family transcriptional regulator
MSSAEFPKRLPRKLKSIRQRLAMTPDQLASFVGAQSGAQVLAYENDEDELLVVAVMQPSSANPARKCKVQLTSEKS